MDEDNQEESSQQLTNEQAAEIEGSIDAAASVLMAAIKKADGIDDGLEVVLRALGYAYVMIAVGMRQDQTALGTPVPLAAMMKDMADTEESVGEKDEEDTVH